MERLTIRHSPSSVTLNKLADDGQVLLKLADYEDAEEQGLLLRLPCKVGDTIYRLWYVVDAPYRVQEEAVKALCHVVAIMEDGTFGKSVFLTRQEAEQALAEMQKG